MVNLKKLPKGGGGKPEEAQNFDDFLETLDDNDSDSDSDSSEEEVGEGSEESEGETAEGQNGDNGIAEDGGYSEDDDEDESEQDGDEEPESLDEEEVEESDEGGVGDEDEVGEEEEDEEFEYEDLSNSNGISKESGDAGSSAEDDGESDSGSEEDVEEHKKSLKKLSEIDPDFFEFLKENDADLLKFEDSGDEGSGSEDDDEEGPLHKPPEELEEASDSEAEEERIEISSEEQKGKLEKFLKKGIVNLYVIADWETKLSTTRDLGVLVNVIEAFECAVQQILQDENIENPKWKVDGSANFNALIRLCIKHVKGFCVRYLCGSNNVAVSENKFDQRPLEFKEKCSQKWNKLRSKIKSYMATLVEFMKSMGNSDAVRYVLKHCMKMSGFWALMASKSYKLVKTLINIWSQGEDSCRITAFLTIIRMANYNRDVFLVRIYKQMYMAYVANCKFTSVNTLGAMNLMRRSLVEVYKLDTSLAYSIAFPFIRQLAIHLRNAVTAGTTQNQTKHSKKEASTIVYSWQFVHSLHLWVDLLAQTGSASDENLKLLIYPVVQICLGVMKLIPTKKYIPLRFQIVEMLIKLQEETHVFIPILPLITQVLFMTDFSAKSVSKFSVRPLDMTCCLKADTSESGYTKAVSDNVFDLILKCCKAVATELSFPEIVTPTLMQLRSFLKKKCKNSEVVRKFRTLIEKIESNSKYISDRRNKALETGSASLSDIKSQQILRVQMETSKPHPPILEFATAYLKTNAQAQAKMRKVQTETREEKLIPKPSALKSKSKKADTKLGGILDSDADDDSETEFKTKLDSEPIEKKSKKLKRKLKKDDSEEEPSQLIKKKKKKMKKSRIQVADSSNDAQDELVDLEFSD